MAATNFQIELNNAIPSGGERIRLVGKPSVWPGLGFTIASIDDTYPSSGTPATPTLGLGALSIQSGIIDATYDGDRYIWTAPAPCVVVSIIIIASVIEATGANSTIQVRKVPSGTVISSGTALIATAVNAKTGVVADTPLTPTLSSTASDLVLAAGNSLALDFSNALTEFIGCLSVNINLI